MTGISVHSRWIAELIAELGVDIDEDLTKLGARRYQFLLQAIGNQSLDAGTVRGHTVRQRIAHQR